jgi:hypothetical protein
MTSKYLSIYSLIVLICCSTMQATSSAQGRTQLTENDAVTLLNNIVSDPSLREEAAEIEKRAQLFLKDLVTDSNGNLQSFNYAGKTWYPTYLDGQLKSITSQSGSFKASILPATSKQRHNNLVVKDTNGRVIDVSSLAVLQSLSPSLSATLVSGLPLETADHAELVAQAKDNIQNATNLGGIAIPNLKSRPIFANTCADSCDAERDTEAASCDFYFEAEMAAVASIAVVADKITNPPVRTAALMAAGAAGILAAASKYSCKASAIVRWGACKASC